MDSYKETFIENFLWEINSRVMSKLRFSWLFWLLLNVYIFQLVQEEDLWKAFGKLQTSTWLQYMLKKVLMLDSSIIQNVKLKITNNIQLAIRSLIILCNVNGMYLVEISSWIEAFIVVWMYRRLKTISFKM